MRETQTIASFIANLKYEDLQETTVEAAKKCLLDYFGCTLFATQTDMGKIITDYCKKGVGGKSNIFPDFTGRYETSFAALANGTCAHGFELDDINTPSISHPGAPVISAVLALAQERGCSGKEVITAIVAGYEVMSRVGSAISAAHIAKGFHPTASFGTFGAAAGCCKLLGLSEEQAGWALGIAGSFASGLVQFSVTGSMVKRIHAGKSAQQGVICACLAEKGFTGPAEILEGKFGFCRVFKDDVSEVLWDNITDGLGDRYAIEDTTFKPSAACGGLHATIECMEKIREGVSFAPETIEKIVVPGSRNLTEAHNVYRPDSILAAQYSLPFTVAMGVLGYLDDPRVYLNDDILRNEAVLAAADKVTTEFDPEDEALYPMHFCGHIRIYLTDGSVYEERVTDPKGSVYNPFSLEDLKNKYKKLVRGIITDEQADNLLKNILEFEKLNDLYSLLGTTA